MSESNNQLFVNPTVLDHEPDVDEAISRNVIEMSESNNQLFVNPTVPDHEPDIDEAISRNGAVSKVISTSSGPGLLDLPPEIRMMIFRHLLVHSSPLSGWRLSARRLAIGRDWIKRGWIHDLRRTYDLIHPNLGLMRTCKLIHNEAFDVLFKENQFDLSLSEPPCPLTPFPRVVNTIQNIETMLLVRFERPRKTPEDENTNMRIFVQAIHLFGNPSIIRRNFTVRMRIENPSALKWFVGALGRFTNFVTIDLQLDSWGSEKDFLEWCEYLKTALEPVLGYADEYKRPNWNWKRSVKCFRFHPVDHQNHSRESNDADWADSLDGIRLGWNPL
ncbi:hypothetical protein MMC22_011662 [Lobaria immixta]|nr:hypothetical protein [Lobaria immixta]